VITNETVHKIEERFFVLDTIYNTYCDTDIYSMDTLFLNMGSVATYDFEITNIISIASDTETFIDTSIISGLPFAGVVYEQDTMIQLHYMTAEGCDSLVHVNLHLLPVSINDSEAENQFLIYPNPTDGNYTILLDLKESQRISIALYNGLGTLLVNEPPKFYLAGKHSIPIRHSHLSNGVYMLTVQSSDWKRVEKIILQKN